MPIRTNPSLHFALRLALRLALTAACITLAACRTDSAVAPGNGSSVYLTIDRLAYLSRDTARGALVNRGTSSVPYSFCAGVLERQTLAGWETAQSWYPPCAYLATSVAPGESVPWTVVLSYPISSGTYRLSFPGVPSQVGPTPPFIFTAQP